MEAVIGQSMLDTVLLQVTLPGCRAGALQTTSRFSLSLLLQVAQLNQFEVSLALLIGEHRHFDFGLDGLVRHDVEEVRPALFEFQATSHFVHILALEEGMDCTCGQLAPSHTIDNRPRAQLRLATSQNAPT